MPLVRLMLREDKPPDCRRAIGLAVRRAMTETVNIPAADRLQVISGHSADDVINDPAHLDIDRGDDIVLIQTTLNAGRTTDQKKALFARIAQRMGDQHGVRPQDELISLVEVPRENRSFGSGQAKYA